MSGRDVPWISVIIPARNAGPWIADALSSLQGQSDDDWEAIIVDDGSTDNTAEIGEAFGRGDARIDVIAGVFGGAAAARNAGIGRARASALLFLDADDWLSPNFLARTRSHIETDPTAGAVYGSYKRVAPSGKTSRASFNPLIAERPLDVFSRECGIAIHSLVLKKRHVLEAEGFDATLKTCEDWDLWQRLARNGVRFVPEPEALVFYRMREGSLSGDLDQLRRDAAIVRKRGFAAAASWDAKACLPREGATAGDLGAETDWSAYLSVWCAAAEIGAGRGDGRRFIENSECCEILASRREETAGSIVDGLMVGASESPDELAANWRQYVEHLTSLAETIESRSGSAGCAQALLYSVDFRMLRERESLDAVALTFVASTSFEVGAPQSIEKSENIDTVELILCKNRNEIGRRLAPLGDGLSKHQINQKLIEIAGLDRYLKLLGRPRRLGALVVAAASDLRGVAGSVKRKRRSGYAPVSAMRRAAREVYAYRVDRLADVCVVEDRNIYPMPTNLAPHADERSSEFWEEWFETPDPWNYRSAYEREKYEFTLSLLPAGRVGSALEIACAEGIFTERLAARVEQLRAVDISERALERARKLCSAVKNVTFSRFDLVTDEIPPGQDLIVCSEVLYFLKDAEELASFALRVRDALVVGGQFVTAHAFVLVDDPTQTGFDWNNPFGAKKIHEVFASTPGLALKEAIVTELYRVDSFVRVEQSVDDISPSVLNVEMQAPIERAVARYVIRGGAAELRGHLKASRFTSSIPVLMYHRIAVEGPAELARYRTAPDEFARQVEYLRKNGYYTPSPDEFFEHWRLGRPFAGRPAFVTFDDGYEDFRDNAWEVLYASDFSAHVFLVTDKVGGVADWDARFGDPAPLMDWSDVKTLASDGVTFGSHLASHRRADGMRSADLLEELRRSRDAIAAHTGSAPRFIAPPYGLFDDRLAPFARLAGYSYAFSTREGVAQIGGNPFAIPRLEPVGGMGIDKFTEMMERNR